MKKIKIVFFIIILINIMFLTSCDKHIHTYAEGVIVKEATCAEEGLKEYKCLECDYVKQESIPQIKHEYVNFICIVCNKETDFSENLEYTFDSQTNTYSVSDIGDCKDTNIIIPKEYNNFPVTRIEEYSFSFFDKFESIFIPNTIIYIDEKAFSSCDGFSNIIVDENNEYYKSLDGNLYSKDGKKLIRYAPGKKEEEFKTPDEVTDISVRAFSYSNNLKRCYISSNVTNIDNQAFSDCKNLISIIVDKDNQTYLSLNNCLYSKDKKRFIKYPEGIGGNFVIEEGVEVIEDYAFEDSLKLTNVTIPNTVTTIGNYAFSNCNYIEKLELPSSIISIGERAFEACSKTPVLIIPSSVEKIGKMAFRDCYFLEKVIFEKNSKLLNIPSKTFYFCENLEEVIFEENSNLISIDGGAFGYCKTLEKIKLPEGLKTIAEGAFGECTSLEEIIIPSSVETIESCTFVKCDNLKKVVFKENSQLKKIDSLTFLYCDNITFYCEFEEGNDYLSYELHKFEYPIVWGYVKA